MTTITLDIETIGTSDESVIADIAAGITPPGNITKAETIAAWNLDKKPAAVEEAVAKTSFDGAVGQIVCVGMAINDEPAIANCLTDERVLLAGVFMAIQTAATLHYKSGTAKDTPIVFVGHNVSGFDLRFLWQRAVVLGLKPPACLLKAMKAKPWDGVIADTMIMWSPERERRISLDRLCKALGVPTSKGDMDGSKVWAAFKAGELDKIATYCAADVEATRACYRRMTFSEPDLLSVAA